MKTVRTYGNLAEAGFAASLLEAAGIKALMADEGSYTSGYGPVCGGLRVQVEEADFERALRVLDGGLDAPEGSPTDSIPDAASRIPIAPFVVGAAMLGALAFAVFQMDEHSKRVGSGAGEQTYDFDMNHDGKPDSFSIYRNGKITSQKVDRNFDGKIDEWHFYDGDGAVQRVERDKNFDGKVDEWFVYAQDGGAIAKFDTDFNGLADCVVTYEFGNPTRVDYMPNESRIVTRREILKDGVATEEWVDENRDGAFDYRVLIDPFGERSAPISLDAGQR